jgi:hypothetical protein
VTYIVYLLDDGSRFEYSACIHRTGVDHFYAPPGLKKVNDNILDEDHKPKLFSSPKYWNTI